MNVRQIFNIQCNDAYNHNIAILRMLLATYVVYFHLVPRCVFFGYDVQSLLDVEFVLIQLFQSSGETNPAVLAFLVVSGYCIHRNGLRMGNMQITSFMLRRVFRIVPMLLLGTILGIYVFKYFQYDDRIYTITNTTFISAATIFYKLTGAFAFAPYRFEDLVHQANGPLITCIVEFWLYLTYPIFALVIMKYGNKPFWVMLLIISCLGAAAYSISPTVDSWWHNGSFLGFLTFWWIGVYAVDPQSALFKYKKTIIAAFLLFTLILIVHPRIFLLVELKKIALALNVAVLLRWSENFKIPAFGQSFFSSSYSLYALHLPLICIALFYGLNIYVACTLILMVSYISYLLIEKPFINLGKILIASMTSSSKVVPTSI